MSNVTLSLENNRIPVLSFVNWLLKAAVFWLVLLVGTVVASQLVHMQASQALQGLQDGPLSLMQAFLAVNAVVALTLALLASRLRCGGVRLAAVLFVALFCIQTGMALIETLWFKDAVGMPMAMLIAWGEQAAIVAALLAVAGAFLFHPAPEAVALPSSLWPRILLLAAIYIGLYFAAGYFIAWQFAAVRDFYTTGGHHIPDQMQTLVLQCGRGVLWSFIALFIASQLKGSLLSRAAVLMVVFAVLTALQLVMPNPLMPWPVRVGHLVEIGVSEAAYGIIAAFVLLARVRTPLADKSPWRLFTGRA